VITCVIPVVMDAHPMRQRDNRKQVKEKACLIRNFI